MFVLVTRSLELVARNESRERLVAISKARPSETLWVMPQDKWLNTKCGLEYSRTGNWDLLTEEQKGKYAKFVKDLIAGRV